MRYYIVMNKVDIGKIDFSEINQTCINTLTYSNNSEKILLSYMDTYPSFLNECVGVRSIMSRMEAIRMIDSKGWMDENEEYYDNY